MLATAGFCSVRSTKSGVTGTAAAVASRVERRKGSALRLWGCPVKLAGAPVAARMACPCRACSVCDHLGAHSSSTDSNRACKAES